MEDFVDNKPMDEDVDFLYSDFRPQNYTN